MNANIGNASWTDFLEIQNKYIQTFGAESFQALDANKDYYIIGDVSKTNVEVQETVLGIASDKDLLEEAIIARLIIKNTHILPKIDFESDVFNKCIKLHYLVPISNVEYMTVIITNYKVSVVNSDIEHISTLPTEKSLGDVISAIEYIAYDELGLPELGDTIQRGNITDIASAADSIEEVCKSTVRRDHMDYTSLKYYPKYDQDNELIIRIYSDKINIHYVYREVEIKVLDKEYKFNMIPFVKVIVANFCSHENNTLKVVFDQVLLYRDVIDVLPSVRGDICPDMGTVRLYKRTYAYLADVVRRLTFIPTVIFPFDDKGKPNLEFYMSLISRSEQLIYIRVKEAGVIYITLDDQEEISYNVDEYSKVNLAAYINNILKEG